MAEKIYLATLGKQEEILAAQKATDAKIDALEDRATTDDTDAIKADTEAIKATSAKSATKDDLTKAKTEIITKIGEGGGSGASGYNNKGFIRYQQPTRVLDATVKPIGNGIGLSWKDPRSQYFYEDHGLADAVWKKTRVVWRADGATPTSDKDGTYIDTAQQDAHFVTDTEKNADPKWAIANVDNEKPHVFRFFTYGNGELVNDDSANSITYDPDMERGILLGASQEKMLGLFRMSTGFGRRVRIGLGLTDEALDGQSVARMDTCGTYDDFLADKPLLDAVNKYYPEFQRALLLAKDGEIIARYIGSGSSDTTWNGWFLDAVIASDAAMRAVIASDTAMRAVIASDTATKAIADSDAAMKTLLETKDVWTKHTTLTSTRKTFKNSNNNLVELVASVGLMVAISTKNDITSGQYQTLYSGESKNISSKRSLGSKGQTVSWDFVACDKFFTEISGFSNNFTLTYDHYTAAP